MLTTKVTEDKKVMTFARVWLAGMNQFLDRMCPRPKVAGPNIGGCEERPVRSIQQLQLFFGRRLKRRD